MIGNAGANTYFGPSFFNADLAITKSFSIHESIAAKFRMDAFNAFNHINARQPEQQRYLQQRASINRAQ